MKVLLSGMLVISFFLSPTIYAQSSNQTAKTNLEMAYNSLIAAYNSGSVSFRTESDKTAYLASLLKIQETVSLLKQTEVINDKQEKLDGVLQEARLVQTVMASYFGSKDMFGYYLKRGPVSIQVGAGGVYEKIIRKFPFLSGVIVGGTITINPGEQIVTQFNSLKTEFYGLLVEASYLDKTDSRIYALANWGKNTKVKYPGETFGKEIIEFNQFLDLKLGK